MNYNLLSIINEEIEKFDRSEYLRWKRKNITLRGIKNYGEENNVYGSWGKGLYTVPLSNKSMAKEYGNIYFVIGAIPQKPKIVQSVNAAEMLRQDLINKFCKENNVKYDPSYFEKNTSIEEQMIKQGYDGIIIKGREMVNFTPDNDEIRYFSNENQLIQYYEYLNNIR